MSRLRHEPNGNFKGRFKAEKKLQVNYTSREEREKKVTHVIIVEWNAFIM